MGLLILLGISLTIGWWYWSGMQPPPDSSASIEAPQQVSVGEEFDLRVHLKNDRLDRPFHLTEIFVDQPFDDYFTVVAVHPKPSQRHRFKLAIVVLYKFDVLVPPRSSQNITFRLRAARPGTAVGDFLVSEGRHHIKLRQAVNVVPKGA